MEEKAGVVFSIAADNAPVPGCTVSKNIYAGGNSITYFSLAKGTDISAEMHPCRKIILVAEGMLELYGTDFETVSLKKEDGILVPENIAVGMKTAEGAVYTEIVIRKEDRMNELVKAGEVFRLADLVPYQEGKIVNMDVAHGEGVKFAVMAFDAGTGLSEHAAPGEAMSSPWMETELSDMKEKNIPSTQGKTSISQREADILSRRTENSKWHCF